MMALGNGFSRGLSPRGRAAEVGRLRSLTLANARTGVKTASEQRLRNPLLTNLTTCMRLVGFPVESGGGRVEHLSDGTNLGAGPFDFWKGPGLELTSSTNVKSTHRFRRDKSMLQLCCQFPAKAAGCRRGDGWGGGLKAAESGKRKAESGLRCQLRMVCYMGQTCGWFCRTVSK